MTLMHKTDYLVKGEYYVCYEVTNTGYKNIAIGVLKNVSLRGTILFSTNSIDKYYMVSFGDYPWNIYSGSMPSSYRTRNQYIFKLTEEEFIRHIILETI